MGGASPVAILARPRFLNTPGQNLLVDSNRQVIPALLPPQHFGQRSQSDPGIEGKCRPCFYGRLAFIECCRIPSSFGDLGWSTKAEGYFQTSICHRLGTGGSLSKWEANRM